MITSMHIENFKCFKQFDIELGKFNVLIGPNDSGKTALHRAILLPSVFHDGGETLHLVQVKDRVGVDLGPEIPHGGISPAEPTIAITQVSPDGGQDQTQFVVRSSPAGQAWTVGSKGNGAYPPLGKVSQCQFDPSRLREPVELSHGLDQDGLGLPAFLARLSLNHPEARDSLQDAFRRGFPFYTGVKTIPRREKNADVLHLRFPTIQKQELPAASVSDGLMVSLGFLALAHDPEPPSILLVEEPENHVHHASLKEIVKTLKQLSSEKGVQVILTTHSPYLLDQVAPEQVRVFYKDDEGAVHARKLSDHPEVESLKKHFMTGEIWTGFESDEDIVKKAGGFE